eukprot:GHVP01054541.1.p1 GENE.GHVP01054541.1~~GHVP01054541.1.p1  ORF type:complete len:187 (-),score=26.37 GHVP01054541.1:45-605(-)
MPPKKAARFSEDVPADESESCISESGAKCFPERWSKAILKCKGEDCIYKQTPKYCNAEDCYCHELEVNVQGETVTAYKISQDFKGLFNAIIELNKQFHDPKFETNFKLVNVKEDTYFCTVEKKVTETDWFRALIWCGCPDHKFECAGSYGCGKIIFKKDVEEEIENVKWDAVKASFKPFMMCREKR